MGGWASGRKWEDGQVGDWASGRVSVTHAYAAYASLRGVEGGVKSGGKESGRLATCSILEIRFFTSGFRFFGNV